MKRNKGIALLLLSYLLLASMACKEETAPEVVSKENLVEAKATAFFDTFAERSDWDKFCSFYREDLEFKDVILQIELDSLWKFKRFYKWDEEGERFKKLSPEQRHLTVKNLVVEGNTAVATGRVNPFYYDGRLIDTDWGMDFTIWLFFDEELQIVRQIDWFEYDSYTLENMIERCRENGFEAIPDWLDLSK